MVGIHNYYIYVIYQILWHLPWSKHRTEMVLHRSKAFCDPERVWPKGINSDNIFCLCYHQLRKPKGRPKKERSILKLYLLINIYNLLFYSIMITINSIKLVLPFCRFLYQEDVAKCIFEYVFSISVVISCTLDRIRIRKASVTYKISIIIR